jgi:phosphoglycolate phosphatase-like HAD superfamily hydrolase
MACCRTLAYNTRMQKITAIISDADGTLVNTVYLIRHGQYEAAVEYLMNRGIAREEIPAYGEYESFINRAVGGSTRETFEKTLSLLFGSHRGEYLKKIDFDELDRSLEPIQDRLAPLYVHPFHGLTELFSWTGKAGIRFGIFTSGNRRMIVRNFGVSLPVLGYTDLFRSDGIPVAERFSAFLARAKAVYGMPEFGIVTCDDVTRTKPDPEGLLKLMDRLHVQPDEAIVLGDHSSDMRAAIAAGIRPIGISHGFGSPAELTEAGAVRIVDDLATLPELIGMHNSGERPLI